MADSIKFMHDLADAEENTKLLEEDTTTLEDNLIKIDEELANSKSVNKKLHQLKDSLKTASNLLKIVAIIPQIGSVASTAKRVIDVFVVPISKATVASDNVEKVVQPARKKVQQLVKTCQAVDEELLKIINAENSLIVAVGETQKNLSILPESEMKEGLNEKLDNIANALDPVVLTFDSAQIALINTLIEVEKNVNDIPSMGNVSKGINDVMSTLKPLTSALQSVSNALSQTIHVPYGGYPKICHKKVFGKKVKYTCGWKTVHFSFTVRQILNGVGGVIDPVMKELNKGVDKVLSPLLKQLNLNINLPDIPGLDSLTDITDNLDGVIANIESEFNQLFQAMAVLNQFDTEISKGAKEINAINNECETVGQS